MEDTQPFSHNNMSPWEPSSGTPVDTQDVLCDIPCEYCGSSCPASNLSEHQASCEHNPLVKAQRQTHGRKGAGSTGEGTKRRKAGREGR